MTLEEAGDGKEWRSVSPAPPRLDPLRHRAPACLINPMEVVRARCEGRCLTQVLSLIGSE